MGYGKGMLKSLNPSPDVERHRNQGSWEIQRLRVAMF
jgi:hypothetical protein